MKKIWRVLALGFAAAFALGSCASAPKTKEISGTTEILEHKGTVFGVAQPEWVGTVLATPDQKTLSKALGINKHIWVVTKSGESLDFVKTWADQVDARAEIGASIKQGISDFVGAKMEGEASGVEETIERYSARASTIKISGLNKETDWWVRGYTQLDKKEGNEPKYTYMVIYSIDEDLYQKQIKEAFKGEDDAVIDELIDYLMKYTLVEDKD